ncbi:MAG: response regulator transcription factor [Acidimicrobiia bacterium]|nr:response regulator transcription factor [Acidimicrobiia bacterium]
MRVLVVEDEQKVADALKEGLETEGYDVEVRATRRDASARVEEGDVDIVLLDLMLPDGDGLDLLSEMRGNGRRTPVLVLTARDTLGDRVTGLDRGADDYLVKPFAFDELLARMRALLRRGRLLRPTRRAVSDLEMDLLTRVVTRAGQNVELTPREFAVLECLLAHEGEVVSRATLVSEVWKESARSITLDNVIDVHIARLRRKIDDPYAVKLIHTVRGVGFVVREGVP